MVDPFYPYFLLFPPQPATTSGGWSPVLEPRSAYWRILLHSETGLELILRKLPRRFSEEFLEQYKVGTNWLKSGKDWEAWGAAEKCFLRCKEMLSTGEVKVCLGTETQGFLLAWTLLPLAQLYQSRESADMLKEALAVREEILELVKPLQCSHASLVRVCKTFCFTAKYEWGKSIDSSDVTKNAIEEVYAFIQGCDTREAAEVQICLLLGVDYEVLGRLEMSLGWIEEANRLWLAIGNSHKYYFLELHRAKLLMWLGRIPDAVTVLKESFHNVVHDDQVYVEVHELLRACYTSLGFRAATAGNALEGNRLLEQAEEHAEKVREEALRDVAKVIQDREHHHILHYRLLDYSTEAIKSMATHGGYQAKEKRHEKLVEEQRGLQSCTSCEVKAMYFLLMKQIRLVPTSQLILETRAFPIENLLGLLPEGYDEMTLDGDIKHLTVPRTIPMRRMISTHQKSVLMALSRQKSSSQCNYEHEAGIAEQVTSPTGCCPCPDEVNLVQSQVGFSYHLQKLPLPLRLAFRKHSDLGRLNSERAEWDDACLEFEQCLEILEFFKMVTLPWQGGEPEVKKACDWLMVWSCTPLADIYQFRKKQFIQAYFLRRRMNMMIPSVDPNEINLELRILKDILTKLIFVGMYEYYDVFNLPEKMMDKVVSPFGYSMGLDEWASEEYLLKHLVDLYHGHGRYETALHFALQAKQKFEHRFSGGREHEMKRSELVVGIMKCLWGLERHSDVENVKMEYWESTDLRLLDFPSEVQWAFKLLGNCKDLKPTSPVSKLRKDEIAEIFTKEALYHLKGPWDQQTLEARNWRRQSWQFEEKQRYAEAIESYKKSCVEGAYTKHDYSTLGRLYWYKSMTTLFIPSFTGSQIKHFLLDRGGDFKGAVEYLKKAKEISSFIEVTTAVMMNLSLTILYGAVDYKYEEYLESISQILPASASVTHFDDSVLKCSYFEEIITYLRLELPVQTYGECTAIQYAHMLDNMAESKRYTDGWIEVLERHKSLYSLLQNHHLRRVNYYSILNKLHPFRIKIRLHKWNAFLYSEGERAQLMLHQLGSPTGFKSSQQSCGLDASKRETLKAIRKNCATLLKGNAIFVQYSQNFQDMPVDEYVIFVTDQRGNLSTHKISVQPTSGQRRFEEILNELYGYLEPGKSDESYDAGMMKKDLEFLYDVLIRPIAHHLDKMKPDDKLILSPCELLTKVPFAALRDRDRQKYLIDCHTIALTPSLGVLKICNERLQNESDPPSYPGRGSKIVALGNPEYNVCRDCTKTRSTRKRLEGTGKEVEDIVALFGARNVVQLLQKDATAEKLRDWASNPAHQFRPALVHIGAHGVIDQKDHRKSVLQLACPPGSAGPASGASTSASAPRDHQLPEILEQLQCSNSGPRDCSEESHDLMVKEISMSEPQWRAELVVLSACRTSRGRITGEGVLSLARAFIIAGVPCVVASLWNVDDARTPPLMKSFYHELRNGADVATALRTAMLHEMRLHDAVENWAPFNVWGVPSLQIPQDLRQTLNASTSQSGPDHGDEVGSIH